MPTNPLIAEARARAEQLRTDASIHRAFGDRDSYWGAMQLAGLLDRLADALEDARPGSRTSTNGDGGDHTPP